MRQIRLVEIMRVEYREAILPTTNAGFGPREIQERPR
jgi:hypothetical protein